MLFDYQDHLKIPFRFSVFLDVLTDEEAGMVINAIMLYCKDGSTPNLNPPAFDAWLFLKRCADYQESNPRWRGGDFDGTQRERFTPEYKQWREAVFTRDDYTCQFCGKRGGKINAHHIKAFSKYPELRLSLNNGITLCEECHRQAHKGG